MRVSDACNSYFNGFQEIANCRKNNSQISGITLLKILSYFTGVIPLMFAAVYGADSLCGRICKKQHLSSLDNNVNLQAKKPIVDNKHSNIKLEDLSSSLKTMHTHLINETFRNDSCKESKDQTYKLEVDNSNVTVVVHMDHLLPDYSKGEVQPELCGGRVFVDAAKITVSPSNAEVEQSIADHFRNDTIEPWGTMPPDMKLMRFSSVEINGNAVTYENGQTVIQ